MSLSEIAGRVIGTEDSTPLEFWVAVAEGRILQLDDIVALERELPSGETVSIYGLVTQVRARHLKGPGSIPTSSSSRAESFRRS